MDFAINFYYLDAVSLKSKKNDEKKVEELKSRVFLQYFSIFLLLQWFSLPFFLSFALCLSSIGQHDSQLDE